MLQRLYTSSQPIKLKQENSDAHFGENMTVTIIAFHAASL